MEVSRKQRIALRVCWAAAGGAMAILAIQFVTGVGGDGVTQAFQKYLYNALLFAGAGFCLAPGRSSTRAWWRPSAE